MVTLVHRSFLFVCAVALVATAVAPAHAEPPDYSSWYFAEGSTNAVVGFEQEILVGNPHPTTVRLLFRFYPQDGDPIADYLTDVAPLSRTGFSVRALPGVGTRGGIAIAVDALDPATGDPRPIVAERTMYWGGGFFRAGGTQRQVVTDLRGGTNEMGVNRASTTWYFAEGEGKFFNTFIAVANPGTATATVTARYFDESGKEMTDGLGQPMAETLSVAPGQRGTFWPTVGIAKVRLQGQAGFATVVESDEPVVAERQMYWAPGRSPFGIQGGHAAAGVADPSATWLFAEGIDGVQQADSDLDFRTFVLLLNTSATETVDASVAFFGNGGTLLATVNRTLPPRARGTVATREIEALRDQAFAIRVTQTSTPGTPLLVAERAVYWRGFTEGHATAGATTAATRWGFAEGLQGGFLMYQDQADEDPRRFHTFYPVYNPGATDATVTVHFYTEGGDTGTVETFTVPAMSRETFWALTSDALAHQKFAAFFASDQPIVVERVVYWAQGLRAGHASMGAAWDDTWPAFVAPSKLPDPPGDTFTATLEGPHPSGGTRVRIEGSGFGHAERDTRVSIGGQPALHVEVENGTTITAVVPPGGPAEGTLDVTVETRGRTITLPNGLRMGPPEGSGPPTTRQPPSGPPQ